MPHFAVRILAVLFLKREHVTYSGGLRYLVKISKLVMDEKRTEEDQRPYIDTSSNQGSSGITRSKDNFMHGFWPNVQRLAPF